MTDPYNPDNTGVSETQHPVTRSNVPFNNIVVVPLMGADGSLVRWVAGTELDTSRMAAQVWTSTSEPGTAISCFKDYAICLIQHARENAEKDGVLVNGNVFPTDSAAQVKYLGILVYASSNPSYTGVWKTVNNSYVTLDAAGIHELCEAVKIHIQACFAWEQHITDKIELAETVEQLQAIDMNSGKPVGQGVRNSI